MKNCYLTLLFVATLIAVVPVAHASHIYTSNALANGTSFFTSAQTVTGPNVNFEFDIIPSGCCGGGFSDTEFVTFQQTGGTATNPGSFSLPFSGEPAALFLNVNFNGDWQGTVHVDIGGGNPDFCPGCETTQSGTNGGNTAQLNVSSAVPEPMTLLLTGSGLLAMVRRLRRKN